MEPLVSVIIPTKNSEKFLEKCLHSVKNQTYKNTEIVVVDNDSSDQTKEIAKKYTDKVFNFGPERSAQRNFGVKNSAGDYLIVLDSDMELSEEVLGDCVKEMQTNDSIVGLIIPEESFGEGFWTRCKKLERSFYVGLDWMEAARFFSRKVFEEMGGYDEKNTGTEDYDLPQRIKERYGQGSVGRTGSFIFHNEGRVNLLKTCQKKFYYAKKLDQYKKISANEKNYKKQSSIARRYMLFLSKPGKLLKNPAVGVGMLFMKTCEFASGGLGYLAGKADKKQ